MHTAAVAGHLPVVKYLAGAGASILEIDNEGVMYHSSIRSSSMRNVDDRHAERHGPPGYRAIVIYVF